MPKPNFFLIGAPKCGTTALTQYLSEHPNAYICRPKEPAFWCSDLGTEPHALSVDTLVDYEALFAKAVPEVHRVIGEGTTAYLRSPGAVKKIFSYNPDAKFVAILRNPVDVIHAFHMEQLYTGLEHVKDISLAWADQSAREHSWDVSENDPPDSLLYRRIATFSVQIIRFFSAVPQDHRMILIYEDFRANPRKVWLQLLDFLELPDDGRSDFSPRNVAHVQRFPTLSRFLLAPPKPIAPTIKALRMHLLQYDNRFIRTMKRFLNVKRQRELMSSNLRNEILSFYRSDIEKLEVLLGRSLNMWI